MLRYEEDNPEAEANWFAAELLMPGPLVRRMCNVPLSFASVEEIARSASRRSPLRAFVRPADR